MSLPRVNHDDTARLTQFIIMGTAGWNGQINPDARMVQARNPGSEFVQVIVDRRDGQGRVYANDAQGVMLLRSGWQGAIGGGGSGSSGGAGGAPTVGAMQAVASQQPIFTGGGRQQEVGASDQIDFDPPRQGEFTGINTFTPEEALGPNETPWAVNFNGIERIGALCVRRGMLKLLENIDTVTYAASPLASTYQGNSLALLTPTKPRGTTPTGDTGMLLVFSDGTGVIGTNAAQRAMTVKQAPLWRKQRSLDRASGLTLSLASAVAGRITATVVYPNGQAYREIVAVTIRYSIRSFPLDVDGSDDRSRGTAGTEPTIDATATNSGYIGAANRTTWDGSSTAFVTNSLTSGATYYVTAWAMTREGMTLPFSAKIVVS